MSKSGGSKLKAKSHRTTVSGRLEGRKELLAEAMRSWAREELHFEDRDIPKVQDLKLLLKDSDGIAMWDHLVACIRPPNHVEVVKKNLQLHLGSHGNNGPALHVERSEVGREMDSLELAISQMEAEISRLKNGIGTLARDNEVAAQAIQAAGQKRAVLLAHSVKSDCEVELLNEYTRRISQRKDCFSWPEQETSYHTVSGRGVAEIDSTKPVVLESACKKSVREACDAVKRVLDDDEDTFQRNQSMYGLSKAGTSSYHGKESLDSARGHTWSKVEALQSTHPPGAVMQSLCELVRDETRCLLSTTANLDLAKDAAQLRFQLDPTTTKEASTESQSTSLLQSIEDHLLEAQLHHIQRCMECKLAEKAARLSRERLDKVKGEVEALLMKELPLEDQQELRELLRGVVFQTLEESGCQGMLNALLGVCVELEKARTEKREEQAMLQAKREQIEQFAETTESKQTVIRKLAKLNSSGKERIQRQRSELELYVERSVCGHEVELLALGAGLGGMGRTELDLFSRLDLRRMTRTPGFSTKTCDLSVHRLRPNQPSGYPGWEGLLKTLDLPLHTSPHTLLTFLLDSLDKVESLSCELSSQKEVLSKVKQSSVDRASSQGALEGSRGYDEYLRGEGVEQVGKNLLVASQALAQSSDVQRTLLEWWEQPAQHCAPWVTHDNMPFGKWLEQWKVLTAKLAQLSKT